MRALWAQRVSESRSAWKQPLTRPATADENTVVGHPLPKGEGSLFEAGLTARLPTAYLPICLPADLPTASVHGRGGGGAELDFLHEKHKRDHGEEGHAEQPERVGISEHAGLPEQVAVHQAIGLVERLHGI